MQQLANTQLHEETLAVTFSKLWYQEDIQLLADILYQHLKPVDHIEKMAGADREVYRFKWQDVNLVLHFDFYSQSCWLEPETPLNIEILADLNEILSQNVN